MKKTNKVVNLGVLGSGVWNKPSKEKVETSRVTFKNREKLFFQKFPDVDPKLFFNSKWYKENFSEEERQYPERFLKD